MIAVPSIQKISLLFFLLLVGFTTFWVVNSQAKHKKKSLQRIQSVGSIASNTTPISEMKPALYVYYNYKTSDIAVDKSYKNKLLLYVDTLTPQTNYLAKNFIKINLINLSNQKVVVPTQERSLIMIQEALTTQNTWQPIEYWSYDWGQGKSIDSLQIEPNFAIQTAAPRYKGEFQTKIRFKLRIATRGEKQYIYSPAFKATITKEQFIPTENPIGNKIAMSFLEDNETK